MLIGIDASRMNIAEKTGIEKYSDEIVNRLVSLALKQKKHQVVLYSPRLIKLKEKIKKDDPILSKIIPFPRLWTQVRLVYEMLTEKPDLLFVPSHTLPLIHPKKTIVTIHDVAFKYFKDAYSRFAYFYLDYSTEYAVKHATKIIVPSQATKNDLIGFYQCSPEKIEIIYHGFTKEEILVSASKEKAILAQFYLKKGENYFFYLGRLEKKKNLARLISAFNIFLKLNPDWKLVLGGKRGLRFNEIWQTITENKLTDKVLLPGYLSEEEAQVLLHHCSAFIFPSLYEGFGFPLLSAFFAEIPILASHTPALKEIAGNAAHFINPLNLEEMAEGLDKIASDHALRALLIANGKERLKQFSWEECARKTWNLLITSF